jgi:hypothetical protein
LQKEEEEDLYQPEEESVVHKGSGSDWNSGKDEANWNGIVGMVGVED